MNALPTLCRLCGTGQEPPKLPCSLPPAWESFKLCCGSSGHKPWSKWAVARCPSASALPMDTQLWCGRGAGALLPPSLLCPELWSEPGELLCSSGSGMCHVYGTEVGPSVTAPAAGFEGGTLIPCQGATREQLRAVRVRVSVSVCVCLCVCV